MLSLASLRYRHVFSENGGPISRVLTTSSSALGKALVQANAFLQPELVAGKAAGTLFGHADGTGSATSGAVACHMAISEALERWAFLATHRGPEAARYGFDADCSSNGMAAFPGLFRTQAARRARLEALERFALIAWWDGRVAAEPAPCPFPGVGAVRIRHGVGPGEVVILHRRSHAGVAYGHAAGSTLSSATLRASVELARTEFVLTAHRAKGALQTAGNFFEERVLHFASEAGHAEFVARLRDRPSRSAPVWRVLFDGEIPGPWARWTTVWRCAVAMPTDAYLDPRVRFFFW